MAGQPLGRIVAEEAKRYGWEQLNAAYSTTLATDRDRPLALEPGKGSQGV